MRVVGIVSDHAGFRLKSDLLLWLSGRGVRVVDYGTDSESRVDYPDFARVLARALCSGEVGVGIALCGSGNGVSMCLNRYGGVRAAVCWSVELARLARAHNDANVLGLPARFVTLSEACAMVEAFLSTGFDGGRHAGRVAKLEELPW